MLTAIINNERISVTVAGKIILDLNGIINKNARTITPHKVSIPAKSRKEHSTKIAIENIHAKKSGLFKINFTI